MKIKVGYGQISYCESIEKVQILDETVSGKYVCCGMPIPMLSAHGTPYYASSLTGIFLRKKEDITNVHEEELEGEEVK